MLKGFLSSVAETQTLKVEVEFCEISEKSEDLLEGSLFRLYLESYCPHKRSGKVLLFKEVSPTHKQSFTVEKFVEEEEGV